MPTPDSHLFTIGLAQYGTPHLMLAANAPSSSLMNAIRRFRFAALVVLVLSFSGVVAAQTGRVVGTVREAGGNTLPGANVVIAGTSTGAASDINGRYTIIAAPAGSQTLVASFVGFQSDSVQVVVPAGGEVSVDFSLVYGSGGIEVVITGQALGQQTAINEQLNAETISNIVSADRIRELPDENAAAAVSRLPGVSIQNGDQIVVRGIEAKYNTVTVNGVQLPSTTTDRSTGLGFISSNMLAGIEVAKSVTPAMDANTIGGNVNLRLQEAPSGLHFDTMLQGDYNDQDHTADNYRTWASVSDRFFRDRLGAFVQGNARRFNGGGDIASANWQPLPQADEVAGRRPYGILDYSFQDQLNVVNEYGASLLLDYRLPGGKLILQNAYSAEDFDNSGLVDQLFLENGNRRLTINRTIGSRTLLVNSLQGDHEFRWFGVDWSLSHARSRRNDDLGYSTSFNGASYFDGQTLPNWTSEEQVLALELGPGRPGGVGDGQTTYEDFGERRLVGALNVTVPVNVGPISGRLQGGGKYTQLDRDRDRLVYYRRLGDGGLGQNGGAADFLTSIGVDPGGILPLTAFLDSTYVDDRGQYYLDGRRPFDGALNVGYLDDYFRLAQTGWPTPALSQSFRDDYVAQEEIAAGYVMASVDLGRYLNLLGGVRYENFSFSNSAPLVNQTLYDGQGDVRDTLSISRSMGHWFPNIQAQIRPTNWFDIRLAYTQTTSRPDYQYLLASTWVGDSGDGAAGNPTLRPTIADNFDAYFSFHANRIGLFTFGFFAKNLTDIIRPVAIQRRTLSNFEGVFWAADTSAATRAITGYETCVDDRGRAGLYVSCGADGVATGPRVPDVGQTGRISTYVNNPDDAYLSGFEVDWQTNFWYLPNPLKNVVLNVNYTRLNSEVDYQSIFLTSDPGCSFFCSLVQVDTVRAGRLFQQGNDILNIALGADIGGFSGRVSFRYQGDILVGLDQRDPSLDTFTQPVYGWDFSVRQRLPIDGLSLFLNGVNLSHPAQDNNRTLVVGPDATGVSEAITQIAYYPRRFQLGIRYGL